MNKKFVKIMRCVSGDISLTTFFSLSICASVLELVSLWLVSVTLQKTLMIGQSEVATNNSPSLNFLEDGYLAHALVLSLLIAGVSRIFISWYVHRLGADLNSSIKSRIFAKIFVDPAYRVGTTIDSGNWLNLLNHDASVVGNAAFVVISAAGNIITIVILLGFSALQASSATLFGAGMIFGSYYLISKILAKLTLKKSSVATESNLVSSRLISRATAQKKEIFIYNLGASILAQYVEAVKASGRAQNALVVIAGSPRIMVEVIAYAVILVSLLGQSDQKLIYDISLLCVVGLRTIPLAQSLYNSVATFRGAESSLERVVPIIESSTGPIFDEDVNFSKSLHCSRETVSGHGDFHEVSYADTAKPDSKAHVYRINCNKVSIGYGELVLVKEFSYVFENGLHCLVGRSGSGKSTFLEVLCGIRKPLDGDITLDGSSIQGAKGALNLGFGYLPQDFYLSRDTVFNNITLGRVRWREIPGFDYRGISELLSITGSEGFLESDKVVLGDGGEGLSAGQRQRIGLARALYTNPPFLILDESTANLDAKTEAIVMRALKLYSTYAVIILASHSHAVKMGSENIIDIDHFGRFKGNQ